MRKRIKSIKGSKPTIKQVFFFNGSKLSMEVTNGEGFVEFDEEKINEQYLERSILSRLHLQFIEDTEEDTALKATTEEEKDAGGELDVKDVENLEEQQEEKKPAPPKKSTKKRTASSRKKATTKKK